MNKWIASVRKSKKGHQKLLPIFDSFKKKSKRIMSILRDKDGQSFITLYVAQYFLTADIPWPTGSNRIGSCELKYGTRERKGFTTRVKRRSFNGIQSFSSRLTATQSDPVGPVKALEITRLTHTTLSSRGETHRPSSPPCQRLWKPQTRSTKAWHDPQAVPWCPRRPRPCLKRFVL